MHITAPPGPEALHVWIHPAVPTTAEPMRQGGTISPRLFIRLAESPPSSPLAAAATGPVLPRQSPPTPSCSPFVPDPRYCPL